jgi:hypothetical protein
MYNSTLSHFYLVILLINKIPRTQIPHVSWEILFNCDNTNSILEKIIIPKIVEEPIFSKMEVPFDSPIASPTHNT